MPPARRKPSKATPMPAAVVLVSQPVKRERKKKSKTVYVTKASDPSKKMLAEHDAYVRSHAPRHADAELLLNGTALLQKLIDAKGPTDAIVKHCQAMMRAARRDAKRKRTRVLTH